MSLTVLAAGPDAYAVLLDELLLDCGVGVLARAALAGIPVRPATILLTGGDAAVRDPQVGGPVGLPGQRVVGVRWSAQALDAGGGRVGWLVDHATEGRLLHCPQGTVQASGPFALTVPNAVLGLHRPLRTTRRVLVTGGAASGKSAYAEARVSGEVIYVATGAPAGADADWDARLARHRAQRPAHWRTLETLQIVGLLAEPGPPLLIDGLGTWLARVLDETGGWDGPPSAARGRCAELARALAVTPREVVVVSDEVGDGVVPATRSGGLFRDLLGRLTAAVAAECDEVHRVTAGIGQRLR